MSSNTEASNAKNSRTHLFYNKCWRVYCALAELKDPLVETFIDMDYCSFKSHIALATKGYFKHKLFNEILKIARKN